MQEQFIDELHDPDSQKQLMPEGPVDFAVAVERALNLEIVQKWKKI